MTSPILANAAVAASTTVTPSMTQSAAAQNAAAMAAAPEAKKTEVDNRAKKAEGTLRNVGQDRIAYTRNMRVDSTPPARKVADENKSEEQEDENSFLDEVV